MASTSKTQAVTSIDEFIALLASIDSYDAAFTQLMPVIATLEKKGPAKGKSLGDMLVEPTSEGTDPLDVLSPTSYGIGYLLILYYRAVAPGADPNQMLSRIAAFARECRGQELALYPQMVFALAQHIVTMAEQARNLNLAVQPVCQLFAKFAQAISSKYFTPFHRLFAYLCIRTDSWRFACDTLKDAIIIEIHPLTPINYTDNLLFHYYMGILFALGGLYEKSIEYLETAICAPGSATAAVQVDAYKKLVLVQYLHDGKSTRLPKYANQSVQQHFKASHGDAYLALLEALQGVDLAKTSTVMQKHSDVFRADSNSGLVEECMDRQRPQIVHKLTETYVALSLAEIATHLLIPDPDSTAAQAQTEQLIFDMIRRREIFAEVDRKGGEATVAFLSDPEPFNTVKTSNDIDFRIRMSEYMGQQAKQRSRNVGASKDFLQKALSAASQGGGGMGATYAGMQGGVIDEETLGFGAMRPDAAFDVDDMS